MKSGNGKKSSTVRAVLGSRRHKPVFNHSYKDVESPPLKTYTNIKRSTSSKALQNKYSDAKKKLANAEKEKIKSAKSLNVSKRATPTIAYTTFDTSLFVDFK